MPSTRRVVSRDPDVGRRLDARRPVVGVVVAEARPQRGAGHEEGHDQGDGELHGVVRQARRQARRRLNLGLVGVGDQVRPVARLRREGPDVVDPGILFLAALPRLIIGRRTSLHLHLNESICRRRRCRFLTLVRRATP